MKKLFAAALMCGFAAIGIASGPAQAGIVTVCVAVGPTQKDNLSDIESRIIAFTETQVLENLRSSGATRGVLSKRMVDAVCESAREVPNSVGTKSWTSYDYGSSGFYYVAAAAYDDDKGSKSIMYGVGFGNSSEIAEGAAIFDIYQRMSETEQRNNSISHVEFESGEF